jgi:hypothetical protein
MKSLNFWSRISVLIVDYGLQRLVLNRLLSTLLYCASWTVYFQ